MYLSRLLYPNQYVFVKSCLVPNLALEISDSHIFYSAFLPFDPKVRGL